LQQQQQFAVRTECSCPVRYAAEEVLESSPLSDGVVVSKQPGSVLVVGGAFQRGPQVGERREARRPGRGGIEAAGQRRPATRLGERVLAVQQDGGRANETAAVRCLFAVDPVVRTGVSPSPTSVKAVRRSRVAGSAFGQLVEPVSLQPSAPGTSAGTLGLPAEALLRLLTGRLAWTTRLPASRLPVRSTSPPCAPSFTALTGRASGPRLVSIR